MIDADGPSYRIGAHRLDVGRGLLLRDGVAVHLRAKSFALLACLARNGGRVLGKDELIAEVWPGLTVTDDSLTQAIKDLRRTLGEPDGQAIRTVARRGYVLESSGHEPTSHGAPAQAPRVLVLPLLAEGADANLRRLIDGLSEELLHGLARYGVLEVVARHSAFRFRPEEVAPEDAAAALGAEYFVEGGAWRQAGRLAVTLRLNARASGRQLWGERFMLGEDALREVQETIPHRIVTRLVLDLERKVRPRAAVPAGMDAFGHFVAGVAALRDYGSGVNEAGKAHLERALALDPDFALAHAYLALAEVILGDYSASPPDVLDRAHQRANRAVQLAPDEARCLWIRSMVNLYRGNFHAAELDAYRSLELNPSDADTLMELAFVATTRGRAEEGHALAMRAFAVNPMHPAWYHHDFAVILQMLGRHEEAVAHLRLWPKESASRYTRLAACMAMLGDRKGAAAAMARARELHPGGDALAEAPKIVEFETPEDRARFAAMIQAALESEK